MNVLLQRQEGERSYGDMFRRYSRRVFIAMSAQALAQLNGINVISYYAPLVFEQAGWRGRDAILMTGINGISYLLSTVPPWYVVDQWGRRPILLWGAIAMMISLSSISYFIYIEIGATPTLVVIFVMIYNAAFGASWGPIPWLYPPEILPLSIRAKGASLSTATNWAFNWLVGEMTPILQEWIQWRLYLLHAFFCALSFVIGAFLPSIPRSSFGRQADVKNSLVHIPGNGKHPPRGHELPLWGCHLGHAHARDARRGRAALLRHGLARALARHPRRRPRRHPARGRRGAETPPRRRRDPAARDRRSRRGRRGEAEAERRRAQGERQRERQRRRRAEGGRRWLDLGHDCADAARRRRDGLGERVVPPRRAARRRRGRRR
jgi:hypothetical protein